jgi:hypothetical protein
LDGLAINAFGRLFHAQGFELSAVFDRCLCGLPLPANARSECSMVRNRLATAGDRKQPSMGFVVGLVD